MGIRFEDGNLVVTIEQEIPIFIPEADFSLPELPGIPSLEFPEPPEIAGFALKMKADLDAQLKLQGAEPDLALQVSSGSGSGGGGGGDLDVSFPKPAIDVEAYLKKFAIKLPDLNLTPSFDFPELPDIAGDALKIKADLEAQLNFGKTEPKVDISGDLGLGSGGSSGGGSGGFGFTQPDFKLDIPGKLEALAPALPELPTLPSFDFPAIPDFTKFGSVDLDIDSIKSELNAPGIPGVSYTPGGVITNANVYLKSKVSRVKVL